MVVYHLVDDVAEGYLELTDRLNDRIDALEDHVADDWASARLSSLSRAKVAHDRAVVGGTRP
jgi:Mg2+ and Co2+ transporter CorA